MSGLCVNCGKPGPHFAPPSSGHPGGFTCAPATPEATEREARDDLIRRIDEVGLTRLQPRHVKVAIKVDAYRSADAYAAAVRRAERERLVQIVEWEEEADGPMPDAFWELFRAAAVGTNRDAATEMIRGTIAATKKSILDKLREAK